MNEEGTTLLDNFDLPDTFAITTVSADVFIDILELNGAPVAGISLNTQMNFTSLGSYDTATEGNGNHSWSGIMSANIDNLLAAGGYSGRATRIDVSISNTLTAYADTGAVASIGKDRFSGLAVKVIPEPGTAILLGLGLAGLAGAGRRRN